jgi:uridylate kinase
MNTSSDLLLVAEARRLERLDEVDVEVALGLGGGPIVRGAEEQVAVAVDAAVLPLDLVLPDLVAR